MHASKFATYIIVGLAALLTCFAISALPGGQLNYLLDQLFAVIHAARVHCKKKINKNSSEYVGYVKKADREHFIERRTDLSFGSLCI